MLHGSVYYTVYTCLRTIVLNYARMIYTTYMYL